MKGNQLGMKVKELEKQLAEAQSDKEELSNSLTELNDCYLIKISLME